MAVGCGEKLIALILWSCCEVMERCSREQVSITQQTSFSCAEPTVLDTVGGGQKLKCWAKIFHSVPESLVTELQCVVSANWTRKMPSTMLWCKVEFLEIKHRSCGHDHLSVPFWNGVCRWMRGMEKSQTANNTLRQRKGGEPPTM